MMEFRVITDAAEYERQRNEFLKQSQVEGVRLLPYLDSKGIPTTGVGYNLRVADVRDQVLRSLGFFNNETGSVARQLDDQFAAQVAAAANSTYSSVNDLRSALDSIMGQRQQAYISNGLPVTDARSTFAFQNATGAAAPLSAVAATYEAKIDAWLAGIPRSTERIVFFSLAYSQSDTNPLLGPGLQARVEAGDHPGAWYEIVFRSNLNRDQGVQNRRDIEGALFGLATDGAELDQGLAYVRTKAPDIGNYYREMNYNEFGSLTHFQKNVIDKARAVAEGLSSEAASQSIEETQRAFTRQLGITTMDDIEERSDARNNLGSDRLRNIRSRSHSPESKDRNASDVPLSLHINATDTDVSETLSVSRRLRNEADSLIASDDYWRSPTKQARVRTIFQPITPPTASHPDAQALMLIDGFSLLPNPDAEDPTILPSRPTPELLLDDQPAFDRESTSETGDPAAELLVEADELIGSADYWRSRAKQARVAAIFRHLYPGTIRTAPLDFGEGV
jgi:GH24 family phage-related lysozyme (muramidase)